MDQNIKERIRKLYALANDKAATEDEAATAMRMASGLMAKHGIALSDIGGEPSKAKKGSKLTEKFDQYEVWLANAAGHLFGCRCITLDGGKQGLYFIGRPDNIEAAEQTLMFLTRQVEAFYKQALRPGLTQKARSEFRRTFKVAAASRVQHRVVDLVREMQSSDAAAKGATGSNALVVKGYFDQMFSEADTEMNSIPNLRTQKARSYRTGSGTQAGFAAGNRVKLRQEVQ